MFGFRTGALICPGASLAGVVTDTWSVWVYTFTVLLTSLNLYDPVLCGFLRFPVSVSVWLCVVSVPTSGDVRAVIDLCEAPVPVLVVVNVPLCFTLGGGPSFC